MFSLSEIPSPLRMMANKVLMWTIGSMMVGTIFFLLYRKLSQ